MPESSQTPAPLGAYGLRLDGVDPARLAAADPRWPCLNISREQGADPDPRPAGTVDVGEDAVTVWLQRGGRLDLRREPLAVRMLTPELLSDEEVMHPYLALPAAFANLWHGRHALHGGAFVGAGGAWALFGDKGSGKSSTLASLLLRGHAVLSDDVLVLDGTELFSGPRAVDLREEAARVLGGEPLGVVGARPRWRLAAGSAPPVAPLRGIVHLEWGDAVAIEPVGPAERMHGLIAGSVLRPGPADALHLLALAAVPAWRFVRPRRIDALEAGVDQLLAELPD